MSNVHLSGGLPETVLPPEPPNGLDAGADGAAVKEAVKRNPRSLQAWAALGDMAADPVEAYAYYRVGYHRGLDALRANGWRGSGYVRWRHESNRGFLRSLDGLRRAADEIGERDEERRCIEFLMQLDPEGPWAKSG
jgi:hypothetical protein